MLHVVKPKGRKKAKRRYLVINPPLEAPVRVTLGAASPENPTGGSYGETESHRNYTMPLPIGLLQVSNALVREGNEVYFLDCFADQSPPYPASMHRRTPLDRPEVQRTANNRIRTALFGLPYEDIDRMLSMVRVDEVYVGCTFTYHADSAHRVIELVKARMPDTPVTLGGIYPTLAPEHAATGPADTVHVGPYPGLKPEDLALNYDFLGHPPGFVLIKGTSGCPNRCAYCAVHKLEGNCFSHRDPEDVFAEIMHQHRRFGLKKVGVWDSNILMRYDDYLGPLVDRLLAAEVPWELVAPEGLDYRLMTPEVAGKLAKLNLNYAALAMENVDEDYSRDTLNRRNCLETLEESVEMLHAAGFHGPSLHLFTIIGLPDQSLENVIRNIRYAWSIGCNVTLFPFTPIPGTPVYDGLGAEMKATPLHELHPTYLPCVKDDALAEKLLALTALTACNREKQNQWEHYREAVKDPELVAMLDGAA